MFKTTYPKNVSFSFQLDKYTSGCDIIRASTGRLLGRYFAQGQDPHPHIHLNSLEHGIHFAGTLEEVELIMNNNRGCQKYPHQDMDEHCKGVFLIIIIRLSTSAYVIHVHNTFIVFFPQMKSKSILPMTRARPKLSLLVCGVF